MLDLAKLYRVFGGVVMKHLVAYVIALFLFLSASSTVNAQKIVSVGGGVTEIICELGACNDLVGVDTTSEFPESVKLISKVGYMRALSVEGVASLQPDVVFLTNNAGPPSAIEQLKQLNIQVVMLNAEPSIEGLKNRVKVLGEHLNNDKAASTLIERISHNQKDLNKLLSLQSKSKGKTLEALFLLSHGGHALSIAGKGTSADTMLKLSGIKNSAEQFKGYRMLGQEGIVKMNPDIIVTTDQGIQAWGGADKILQQQGVKHTKAAQNGKLISMDAIYLLGFGPRALLAAQDLHRQVY